MYIKYNSIKVAGCKCFKAKYKNEYLIVVGLFVFTLDFFHVIEFLVNKEFFSLSMLQVINHALIFLNQKNYFPLFWAINFVLNCHEQKFHNISFLMQSREKAVLVNTWRSCGVWVMSAERIRLDCLSSITSNSLLLTALLQSWALSPNVKACHKNKVLYIIPPLPNSLSCDVSLFSLSPNTCCKVWDRYSGTPSTKIWLRVKDVIKKSQKI